MEKSHRTRSSRSENEQTERKGEQRRRAEVKGEQESDTDQMEAGRRCSRAQEDEGASAEMA